MSQLEPLPYVHHPTGMRCSAIRFPDCCPPQPMGCRWCGLPATGHGRQTTRSGKAHTWEHPTADQIYRRMKARRRLVRERTAGAVAVSARCNGVAHDSIGSCVIEAPEGGDVATSAAAAVLVQPPAEKAARCDGMGRRSIA